MWLAGASLVAYVAALALLALAVGIDHSATQWLFAAVLAALAAGMTASLVLRLALVADPEVRGRLWSNASSASRVFQAGALLLRCAGVVIVWRVALLILGR